MPKKPEEVSASVEAVAAPEAKWGPQFFRIKAADKVAHGSSFASPYFSSRQDAEDFAAILRSFPGRFSLVRLEASRETMLPDA